MRFTLRPLWIGTIYCLTNLLPVFAQNTPSISTGSPSSTTAATILPSSSSSQNLQTYLTARRALSQQLQALIAQGATQQQLATWRQQHAAQISALQQQAQALGASSYLQKSQTNQQAKFPSNASPTLRAFLTAQAALSNARAQIHNQLVQSLPSSPTAAQISAAQKTETQLFMQKFGSNLKLQAQQAQTLALQQPVSSSPIPGPLQLPANASPQLKEFLIARDQLMRDQLTFRNQHLSDDPATFQTTMQQWRQQNAARFAQMEQLSQALAQSNSPN